jgi:2,3,4,5-tetrahydropyridine-2-carboxylate N-succinyltransferase
MTHSLENIINTAYENITSFSPSNIDPVIQKAVIEIIHQLDTGQLRVAEKRDHQWQINPWLKKAILLYFRMTDMQVIEGGFTHFFDKIPAKYAEYDAAQFAASGARIVPPATIRKGAYIAPSTVLMPCFVNIGAYIDSGTMIDAWATVGSCAQIGKNVHLSGGVGIGGVLEPLQANPVIIEDNCFIGARSEVVEGMIVEAGSVISMGVYLGQSTRIYDRAKETITYGRIPAGSVVVPGNLPDKDGKYSLYCAVIVKQVDEKTRQKVSINELLRTVYTARV